LLAAATASAASGAAGRDVVAEALRHCTVAAFREQLTTVRDWLDHGQTPDGRTVRDTLGNGIAAARSCATAIHAAVRSLDGAFVELQRFVAALRGDVDTIGAMAGAIWGAANGVLRLPQQQLARLEQRERIEAAANALHARRYGAAAR
jgi:ADP-ribosylglycohydrolase